MAFALSRPLVVLTSCNAAEEASRFRLLCNTIVLQEQSQGPCRNRACQESMVSVGWRRKTLTRWG